MDLLDELMSEGRCCPSSNYPIRMDQYDRSMANRMREYSPNWLAVENKRTQEWDGFTDLMDTLFAGLWKPRMIPVPTEELSQKGRVLKDLLDAAQSTKEWRQFRTDTRMDEVASAIGATVIGERLQLPEIPEEKEGETPSGLSPDQINQLRQELRGLIEEAQAEVEQHKDTEALLWGSENSELARSASPEERFKLAKRVRDNSRVRKLAELVGRMQLMAKQKYRNRVQHGHDEITDIVLGDDLSNLLPEEYAHLADTDIEMLFYVKYVEQNLLQYQFEASEKMGKGPIVCLVDLSGSMNQTIYQGISRIDWALAASLALSVFAKKENRHLYIGLYNTRVVGEWFFPKGQWNPNDVFDIASHYPSGGTDYERPLEHAIAVMKTDQFKKGDLIFITDGECSISSSFLADYDAAKEEMQFRTYGISLGLDGNPVMERLCDDLLSVTDMRTADKALDMAFSL